jgi:hypothetical protein
LRTRLFILVMLAVVAMPSLTLAAGPTGLQLQLDGVLTSPMGNIPSAQGSALSSLFGSSGGFAVTTSLGITGRLFGALRVGSVRGRDKSSTSRFSDLRPADAALLPGSGPYDLLRKLDGIPVQVLLQYRRVVSKARIGYSLEAGAGIVSFSERMVLRSSAGPLINIAGYQREPSYTIGAGLAFPVRGNFDLVAGAHYDGTRTGDGAVWAKGDNPGFVTGAVGLRYPRVTH